MRRPTTAAALLVALALAGCGDPYADPERANHPPPGEQPARPLPTQAERVAPDHLAGTPEDAVRRAAELTTNWTGDTAVARYAQLSRMTVGTARREARESAARLPTDQQLTASGTRSTGTVEAVATRASRGARRELVVVTREILTGDGLREQRWRVTLATAERRGGGWVISRWEPQA